MDLVATLPAAAHTLFDHDPGRLVLGFDEGLAIFAAGELEFFVQGAIDGVARGPEGRYYCTQGGQILSYALEDGTTPEDISPFFAGHPQGSRRIVSTPDGDVWVEGCTTRRCLNGRFLTNPSFYGAPSPVPLAADIYGNLWSLVEGAAGCQVVVLPANGPKVWQPAWLEAGAWNYLFADSVGYIWVIGPGDWRRFCPRRIEAGWQAVGDQVATSAVLAVGFSPDDLLMAAFATGELVELDTNAAGAVQVRHLDTIAARVHSVCTDRRGAIWAATDEGLYRREAAADAWQQTWEKKRGRLPGGGNHDIFAVLCQQKLYIAGGWAGEWGLPPQAHVCDELFAYDGHSEYWQVVSRLKMPRRYNGIAQMEGRVWVIGGETRIAGWDGEGQVLYTVDIYDPTSESWSPGPSLNVARTDPFVMSCNDRIYAIGGAAHNGGPKLDSVESIGPGETAWRFETPLPEPTRQGHGCVLAGIIYCASIDGVYAFDPASGCWDEDFPQPGPIGQGPLAAAYGDEVWLIGGYEDQRIRCYNPKSRTWRPGPDLPVGQAWGTAIVMNGQLLVVGGAHYSKGQETVVFDDRTFALRRPSDDKG